MFALPLNLEAFSLSEWIPGYQCNGVLLKAFSHLLDYGHKMANNTLYKRAVLT